MTPVASGVLPLDKLHRHSKITMHSPPFRHIPARASKQFYNLLFQLSVSTPNDVDWWDTVDIAAPARSKLIGVFEQLRAETLSPAIKTLDAQRYSLNESSHLIIHKVLPFDVTNAWKH
jgi:hypothetical protein